MMWENPTPIWVLEKAVFIASYLQSGALLHLDIKGRIFALPYMYNRQIRGETRESGSPFRNFVSESVADVSTRML